MASKSICQRCLLSLRQNATPSNRPRLLLSPPARQPASRRAFVTSNSRRSTSNQAANALGTSPPTPITSSEPAQLGITGDQNVESPAKETEIHTNPMTETYVAYGSTEEIFKICAAQASYSIPQALEKDAVVPKTANGEDLGVGEGWWYNELGLPPTFSTWAQITILHMHLVITRLRQFPAEHYPPWQQHLMDHFFFEAETRMLTYHNMHANMIRQRYLKDLFTQYRGSQASYDEALVKGDAVLATALWRNLWKGDEDVDTRKMAAVVYYVRASLLGLHQLTDQQVAMAHFQFGPFEDWEDIDLKSKMMDAISESGQSVQ